MIMIMQRSEILVLARGKNRGRETDEEDARQPTNSQRHCEENLWSFITRLQQQQLNHVEANMLYRFFSSAILSPHTPSSLLSLSSSFLPCMWLLTPCFTPAWPALWMAAFLCSLILSKMQQPFCGSLLWGWTCFTLPDRRRKKSKMGCRERNGALWCPTGGKDRETEGTWGQRQVGGVCGGVVSLTEDLPFWGLHKEKRETAK